MSEKKSYLGWDLDFSRPPGEPAFCAPDSLTWSIYKNPVALAIGGVAAVLLEFADARIRAGVWNHSVYPTDPLGRSKRTGIAAMVGVYGPASAARRIITGVNNMHSQVAGTTPEGDHYSAQDTDLLDWVSATALFGFLNGYDRFVRPLSHVEKCRFYAENAPIAAMYGVKSHITSPEDFDRMLDEMSPRCESHQIVFDFLDIIRSGQAARGIPKRLYHAIANGAVSLLPGDVRDALCLGSDFDLTRRERFALRSVGWIAEQVPIRSSPAARSAVRLGLPPSFAWKSEAAKARILAGRPRDDLIAMA